MNALGIVGTAGGVALTSIGAATLQGIWTTPQSFPEGDRAKVGGVAAAFVVLGVTLSVLGAAELERRR